MSIPENEFTFKKGNTIELHYYLNNKSHSMDAFVQNKCETEILALFKEILNTYNLDLIIETEPFGEGGLKRWFKILSKEENKKAILTTAVLASLITSILVTPITTSLSVITESLIEKALEDPELKDLEKEKLQLEILKLKQDLKIVSPFDSTSLEKTPFIDELKVKKKRSTFYDALDKYRKIEKVSFKVTDDKKNDLSDEQIVEKADFKKFILTTDELDPIETENAEIEIISPVLKKGSYKWKGYYRNDVISFYMKSKEFKSLVQNGEVQFENGSIINCLLIIKRKIDDEGNIIITGFDVESVNSYYKNNKPIETPEGKRKRKEKSQKLNQFFLFPTKKDED